MSLQTRDLLDIFSDGIPGAKDGMQQEFGEARLDDVLVTEMNKPLDKHPHGYQHRRSVDSQPGGPGCSDAGAATKAVTRRASG
jgi:hypothetical protein